MERFREEISTFGNFPTMFMGIVKKDNGLTLNDPDILSKHVRAVARPNALEGVGACEAPRGTLFHHYKIDEQA